MKWHGRAASVVRAMERELWRQANINKTVTAGNIDGDGVIVIHGRIDLAALAYATEQALLRQMYPDLVILEKGPICEPV